MRTGFIRRNRLWLGASLGAIILGAAAFMGWRFLAQPPSLPPEDMARLHAAPLAAPEHGMAVFHLGHSLVGPDMPGFVQQLAQAAGMDGASYNSQLGWGTSLRQHWDTLDPARNMAEMNTHPGFRPAQEALSSGDYDAFVMTEMVDLQDAIRWHDSGEYAGEWAAHARAHAPDIRLYLYETWHGTDIEDGWLARLDADLDTLWKGEILAQAMARPEVGTIHVIPAGQAIAALVRNVEAQGGVRGMADRYDLFTTGDDGERDAIHLNDTGMYLVALVHLATLYHIDPRGLPHALTRADGSAADAPPAGLAELMQEIAWQTVRDMPASGIAAQAGDGS